MNAEKTSVAPNVDHAEIAKFEAVASRWWDLEGEFKPLHRINPLRLGYIAERSGGLFGKKSSMSAAAAASSPRAWRAKARRSPGWTWGPNRCRSPGCTPGERYSGRLCSGNS